MNKAIADGFGMWAKQDACMNDWGRDYTGIGIPCIFDLGM